MKYENPVIKGFYPDPSVCFANGKYYMVCSSFQYFPGVPLFESEDLVNWRQIGHVLTKKTQVELENINSSGGIFAPTIRYFNGRFYMVTTNDTLHQNFYVYTDDIYSSWSDPIYVDQGGIDPSLYFEGTKTYFMSNGLDSNGESGVIQCEIDIASGKKLTQSKCIWKGSGGRYLESPHLYKIGEYYYLLAAEGGTEYGHMITCARGKNPWEFENCPYNPILTNRNKAPFIIQGVGHGDLIQSQSGDWFILCLGFRQIGKWMPYHNLGREVFLVPAGFTSDGWLYAGDGSCERHYEIKGDFSQTRKNIYTFENTDINIDWCFLRHPHMENYKLDKNKFVLKSGDADLDMADSPTFIGLRQRDFNFTLSVSLEVFSGEGGVSLYMCENEHYEAALVKTQEGFQAQLKLNIGEIKSVQSTFNVSSGEGEIIIKGENLFYNFYFKPKNQEIIHLGYAQTKYLSSEVSGGFTGVVAGLYAQHEAAAQFENFICEYTQDDSPEY